MAFEYETTDTFVHQQAASKWTSTATLNDQLYKTFWTKDFRTRPTSCKLISIADPVILDDKTVGMKVDAVFSWASIGLKEVPIQLYVFVKKQSEGYRIDSIQILFPKKLDFRGFLLLHAHSFQMYYKNENIYAIADSYQEAVEHLKPNLADKHTFDFVFFSWYQSLIPTPSKAN